MRTFRLDAVQAIDLFFLLLMPWLLIATVDEQGKAKYYVRQEDRVWPRR